jgi:hypothetical protein
MKNVYGIVALLLVLVTAGLAQSPSKPVPQVGGDITGLYSFVREGEFVQIEVNEGKVSGLVSRFKDENPDKAEFVDQFFDKAELVGARLGFRTKSVDGVSFEFSGVVERGPAKTPTDEGYWIIKGTLVERRTSSDGKTSEKVQELTLKSFPEDVEPNRVTGATPADNKE